MGELPAHSYEADICQEETSRRLNVIFTPRQNYHFFMQLRFTIVKYIGRSGCLKFQIKNF